MFKKAGAVPDSTMVLISIHVNCVELILIYMK